jgi:hypothetical protein
MDGFCLRRYSSSGGTNVLVGQFRPHKENVFVLEYTAPFLNSETESCTKYTRQTRAQPCIPMCPFEFF